MTKTPALLQRFILFCFLLPFLFIQDSCKKIDNEKAFDQPVSQAEVTQRFFSLPANASPAIVRIAEEMKKENSRTEYISSFVQHNGYPVWGKAVITNSHNYQSNFSGSSSVVDGDTVVIVPVSKPDSNYINSFVKARFEDGTPILTFYREGDYSNYTFNRNVPADSITAEKATLQIMVLNKFVYGYKKFKVKDNRLFHYGNSPDSTERYVTLTDNQTGPGNTSNLYEMVLICYEVDEIVDCSNQGITAGMGNTPNSSSFAFIHFCHDIYQMCVEFPIWGTGSGFPGTTGGGTTGGGSGGTPNPEAPFPCASSQGKNSPLNPCGPISYPPPIYPVPATVNSIINNVQNPCLNEVYNLIQAHTYKNKVGELLDNFSSNPGINLQLDEAPLSDAYAITSWLQTGPSDYKITFDNQSLPHCSQEFILGVYFHEAIHVYLKEHLDSYDFENISSHTEMLNHYFTDLKNTIHSYFPSINDLDLWAIMYDDIDFDPNNAVDVQLSQILKHRLLLKIVQQFPYADDAMLKVIAEQYKEGGTLGTRNISCN